MLTNKQKRLAAQGFWAEQLRDGNLCNPVCVCGGDDDLELADCDRLGVDVKTLLCRQCGTVRSGTALLAEGAELLYGSGLYRELFDEFGRTEEERLAADYDKGDYLRALVENTSWFCKYRSNPKAFEVGAGTGATLAAVFENEDLWLLRGNDLDLSCARNDRVLMGTHSFMYDIDCLLSVHVLEHFADPVATLLDWATHLSPNGRIVCVVPDLFQVHHNVTVSSSGRFADWWHFPHAWNWCAQTIRLPFLAAGLEVERVQFAPPGTLASVGSLVVTATVAGTSGAVERYLEERS
jgi:SAM-dependent methyltransferase